jgi:hypothetical protein
MQEDSFSYLLESKLASIELLRAAYPDEIEVDEATLANVIDNVMLPTLQSFEIKFKLKVGHDTTLHCIVPLSSSLSSEQLRFSIHSSALSNQRQKELRARLQDFVADKNRDLCYIEFAQFSINTTGEIFEKRTSKGSAIESEETFKTSARMEQKLGQCLIYFHHIKSSFKKRDIVDYAAELSLGGLWKEGFPGVIIIEGNAEDVYEYIRRLQRLRWQHMVVRGERIVDVRSDTSIDQLRQLPPRLEEVETMSDLSARCRSCGLHDLFLTAMKIYKSEMKEDDGNDT